jgi:hypothetical protein
MVSNEGEKALDEWLDKAKLASSGVELPEGDKAGGEFAEFGTDLRDSWPSLSGMPEIKLRLQQAWRLTRHYLLGVQKQRERGLNGAGHRTSGALSQYVAFLDVYVNTAHIRDAGMRLSFPYFIGGTTWRFMHTVAEIACSKDEKKDETKDGQDGQDGSFCVERFKDYFRSFATMYPCPVSLYRYTCLYMNSCCVFIFIFIFTFTFTCTI